MSTAAAEKTPAERSEATRLAMEVLERRAAEQGRDLGHEAELAGVVPVRLSLESIRNPPREVFLLGRMFPLGKSSVLFGPQGKGKSAALAQVLFSLAAGAESLWGMPLLPGGGPVLIYTAEDTIDDWTRKGAAILKAGGLDVARALERLYVVERTDGLVRFTESVTIRSEAGSVSRRASRPTEELEHIVTVAKSVGARAILVETVSNLVDDEDNPTLATFQGALRRIATATGAAVIASHHATKAASRDNDSAIESARGGGALIANARNAVSLFPAEGEEAAPYRDRFAMEDLFVLHHGKPTSSTRAHAPMVLVRCDAVHGAVFRLPEEVELSPEMQRANAERLDGERQREAEALRRLYEVVERALPLGDVSPNRLRERVTEIGIPKRKLESLISTALGLGILKPAAPAHGGRGMRLALGRDPRKPIAEVA